MHPTYLTKCAYVEPKGGRVQAPAVGTAATGGGTAAWGTPRPPPPPPGTPCCCATNCAIPYRRKLKLNAKLERNLSYQITASRPALKSGAFNTAFNSFGVAAAYHKTLLEHGVHALGPRRHEAGRHLVDHPRAVVGRLSAVVQAEDQGLTRVHFSAQLKRFLQDRGHI